MTRPLVRSLPVGAAILTLLPALASAQTNAEALSVEAAPRAIAGSTLDLVATVRIDPGMNVTLTPYLTARGVLSGAVALAPMAVPQPPSGRTVRIETSVPVPANVSGVFTVGIVLDAADAVAETNELDNSAFATAITRVRAQAPDPVVVTVMPQSGRARPDDPVDVDVQVRNAGELPATVTLAAHLSRDLEVSAVDPALGSTTVTVGAGATVNQTISGVVPADTRAGAYSLGVVVDPAGTVAEVSEANNVTVAEQPFTVYFDTLSFDTPSLPSATLTIPYHVALESSGGDGAYTYDVPQGNLPDGLSLGRRGVLEGTPTRSGAFDFTIRVTSDGKTDQTDFSITVSRTNAPLTIATREAPQGFLNMPYEQALVAGGGEAPYSWDLVAMGGVLPPGLDLSPAGLITGVPNTLGTFNFTVEVEDFLGNRDQAQLSIEVTSATNVIVLTNDLDPMPVGEPVSVQLAAAGGVSPYTWLSLSPPPPGLTLAEDGRLMGSPTQVGRWPMFVRVRDGSRGQVTDSATIQVEVVDAGDFAIEQLELPHAQVRTPYEVILTATGGTPPMKWSVARGSALPDDFYIVDGDGDDAPEGAALLYGVARFAEVHAFTIRVEDSFGRRREMTYALTVDPFTAIAPGGGCRSVGAEGAAPWALLLVCLGLARRRRR